VKKREWSCEMPKHVTPIGSASLFAGIASLLLKTSRSSQKVPLMCHELALSCDEFEPRLKIHFFFEIFFLNFFDLFIFKNFLFDNFLKIFFLNFYQKKNKKKLKSTLNCDKEQARVPKRGWRRQNGPKARFSGAPIRDQLGRQCTTLFLFELILKKHKPTNHKKIYQVDRR
jgi:hypothetical protein